MKSQPHAKGGIAAEKATVKMVVKKTKKNMKKHAQ